MPQYVMSIYLSSDLPADEVDKQLKDWLETTPEFPDEIKFSDSDLDVVDNGD